METQIALLTTEMVANRMKELCSKGRNIEAIDELYSDRIISIEPHGLHPYRIEGKISVLAKNKQWLSSFKNIESISISEPLVSGNYFCFTLKMEVTVKDIGKNSMSEICVYEVENGKIVFEQFFFAIQ
ncbi:MAG TPA: nuclear transport factor 2 family protein [Bacteroidia bacterium]|nr:nuclear transport factor 2 family protein [Bacteroidia bacterium]